MKPCNAYGKRCTKYGGGNLSATEDEIGHWRECRPNIYRFITDNNLWTDPDTGQTLTRCTFLYQNQSGLRLLRKIRNDRPEDRRLYPSSVGETILDDFEMIGRKDLLNPRQTDKDLAILMADGHSLNRTFI